MQKIFQSNKYFIYSILGFLILSYYFYVRILIKKLPKNLINELPQSIKLTFLLLFISCSCLCLLNVYKYLINHDYYKPKKNIVVQKMLLSNFIHPFIMLRNIWDNSLYAIHYYVIKKLPRMVNIFKYLGNMIHSKVPFGHLHSLNYIFNLLPKLLVLTFFLTDVFIFHSLNYFYKTSILLLIPLLFNYSLFSILDVYLDCIHDFDNAVIITDKETKKSISGETYMYHYFKNPQMDFALYTYTFTKSFLEKFKDEQNVDYAATLEDFMIDFNVCVQIRKFTSSIEMRQLFYGPKYNIILYFLYAVGWGYVLFLISH